MAVRGVLHKNHVTEDDFALSLSTDEFGRLSIELTELFDRWGALSRNAARPDGGKPRRAYYGAVLGALVDDVEAVRSQVTDRGAGA